MKIHDNNHPKTTNYNNNISSKDNPIYLDENNSNVGLYPTSIIYEELVLHTTIQNDDPLIKTFERFKKKVGRGSIFNSTITLISFSPLVIMFYSRYAYVITGISYSLILIIIFALNSFFSLYINIQAITLTHSENFHTLIKNKIRNNTLLYIYHICSFVYLLTLSVLCNFALIEMIKHIFYALSFECNLTSKIVCISIVFIFVQIPYLFKPNFTVSQVISIGLLALIFLSGITLILELIFFNDINQQLKVFPEFKLQFGVSVCIFSFLFNNSINLIKEVKVMNYYTYKRGQSLIQRTIVLEWVLYIIYTLFSYLNDTISISDSTEEPLVHFITLHRQYKNYPMILFEILSSICLGFKTCSYSYDMVNVLFMNYRENPKNSKIKTALIILILVIINVLIIVIKEKYILLIIGIFGCTSGYILEYAISIYVYNSVFDEDFLEENKKLIPLQEDPENKRTNTIVILNYLVAIIMLLLYIFGAVGAIYCAFSN